MMVATIIPKVAQVTAILLPSEAPRTNPCINSLHEGRVIFLKKLRKVMVTQAQKLTYRAVLPITNSVMNQQGSKK